VDKKLLLGPYLARIMDGERQNWKNLVAQTLDLSIKEKTPGDPVTVIDLAISEDVKKISLENNWHFYSEEEPRDWELPLIIIDPIDGTRELIERRPECAVSIALIKTWDFTSEENEGWLFNPFTSETFTEETNQERVKQDKLLGYVSRSETKHGLFKNLNHPQIEIKDVGSIAYKLGLLASGKIDFVVSLRPKNVWDIAAGTILCEKMGLELYSQGKRITKITHELYRPPLLWCKPEDFALLSKAFEPNGR